MSNKPKPNEVIYNERIENLIKSIKENELKDYTQVYLNNNFNGVNIKITEKKIEDNTNKEIRKGYYLSLIHI